MMRSFETGFLALAQLCFALWHERDNFGCDPALARGGNSDGVIELTTFLIGFGAQLSMPVC